MQLNCCFSLWAVVMRLRFTCSFFNWVHFNHFKFTMILFSICFVFFHCWFLFWMLWHYGYISCLYPITCVLFFTSTCMFVCLFAATNISNSINYSILLFQLHPSVRATHKKLSTFHSFFEMGCQKIKHL